MKNMTVFHWTVDVKKIMEVATDFDLSRGHWKWKD